MNELVPGDRLGPEKVIQIRNQALGLDAVVVVDNVAAGPAIGGIRMAPDVTVDECRRLARAMTLKNAAAELPHGGGKSVIRTPSNPEKKERLIRAFAQAIRQITDYIPGPDMGTDETAMAWIKDEIGRVVGMPRVVGGIPLDEIGATGHGLAAAIEAAESFSNIRIGGSRIAVQGFGAVGKHAARFLADRGATLVAASDSGGTVFNTHGLDTIKLISIKNEGGKLCDLDSAGIEKGPPNAVIEADCDILIPAARPDVIREDNVSKIKARLIVEGANIPATREAEAQLHQRGVIVIPDFIANGGGVICASVEYHGGSEGQAMTMIAEKISRNVKAVLGASSASAVMPRQAAEDIAHKRIDMAMGYRRFS